jgi:FkbH-like protein
MRITDALRVIHNAPQDARPFLVTLACGFTPLHLQTFLTAHLQQALPERLVIVKPGTYGSLVTTLEEAREKEIANLALVIEWMDLDPRLGSRARFLFTSGVLADIVATAEKSLERLLFLLKQLSAIAPIALSTPTLPLPSMFHCGGWQISETESHLESLITKFTREIIDEGILVVRQSYLSEDLPQNQRHDLKSELLLDLPYTQKHAGSLALALSRLLCPPVCKKGLITDLDGTLWSGLVGEDGHEGVRWDLDSQSGLHALYQRSIASFADRGILIGVASKNDASVATKVFERSDFILGREWAFPLEIHWDAKSTSVARILRTWNISADSVVFVDDSPMELAEVQSAHPGIECVQFPHKDYIAGYAMLKQLRDLFGKQKLTAEDGLRANSIRQANDRKIIGHSDPESFLRQADPIVRFSFDDSRDSRALELVNKTNQFNLNGVRYAESDWKKELSKPDNRLVVASYEDRFGILGKIAVLLGTLHNDTLRVRTWVMSCRAFSRRIEHLILKTCFEHFHVCQIEFDFKSTEKNSPLKNFLEEVTRGCQPSEPLSRSEFMNLCPPLYHKVLN